MVNTDNIDKFGHCMICHENLLTKRVVDGKVVDMFLPTYDETFFLLNNGSQMQITICKLCKEKTDLNNPVIHENIMVSCMKGWTLEKEKYPDAGINLDHMSKLSIDCHSENLDKFVIQNKQIALLNMKVEELKEEVSNVINNDS